MSKYEKELFVIHTEGFPSHRLLYRGLVTRLAKVGLKVWTYGDWQWNEPDERYHPGEEIGMPEWEQEVYSDLEEIVPGDVDRDTLQWIITATPGIIVFEISENQLTSGIREEVAILDEEYRRSRFGAGIGIVHFGEPGFFTQRYPHFVSATLVLKDCSEHDLRIGDDEQIQILAFFALRIMMKRYMFREVIIHGETLENILETLSFFWEKALQMINFTSSRLNVSPHSEIIQLVEEVVRWARDVLLNVEKGFFRERLPEITHWILNEFDGICSFKNLSQEGLEAAIDILRFLGSDALKALTQIYQNPVYSRKPGVYTLSLDALACSIEAIACIKGENSCDLLIEDINRTYYRNREILIKGLGHLAENVNQECKSKVENFLMKLAVEENTSAEHRAACIKAIGQIGTKGVEEWLVNLLKDESDEVVRRSIMLALGDILGEKASSLVIDFLQKASSRSRTILASAAWKVNTNEIYDALLKSEPPENDRLRGNLLYSWVKARNSKANKAAIDGVMSGSPYLQELATVLAGDCIKYCNPSQEEKEVLINSLRNISRDLQRTLARYATLSLVVSGQNESGSRAEKVLEYYLTRNKIKLAKVLIGESGVNLMSWPSYHITIPRLLFHPAAEIRHVTTYIVGYLRIEEFLGKLQILQKDISVVKPLYQTAQAVEIMGSTVAEGALLAIKRIKGELPSIRVERP